MKSLLLATFTGRDNITLDIGRCLWAGGFLAMVVQQFYGTFWLHDHFEVLNTGTALGAYLAGGAAALKLKESTEPCSPSSPPASAQS